MITPPQYTSSAHAAVSLTYYMYIKNHKSFPLWLWCDRCPFCQRKLPLPTTCSQSRLSVANLTWRQFGGHWWPSGTRVGRQGVAAALWGFGLGAGWSVGPPRCMGPGPWALRGGARWTRRGGGSWACCAHHTGVLRCVTAHCRQDAFPIHPCWYVYQRKKKRLDWERVSITYRNGGGWGEGIVEVWKSWLI